MNLPSCLLFPLASFLSFAQVPPPPPINLYDDTQIITKEFKTRSIPVAHCINPTLIELIDIKTKTHKPLRKDRPEVFILQFQNFNNFDYFIFGHISKASLTECLKSEEEKPICVIEQNGYDILVFDCYSQHYIKTTGKQKELTYLKMVRLLSLDGKFDFSSLIEPEMPFYKFDGVEFKSLGHIFHLPGGKIYPPKMLLLPSP